MAIATRYLETIESLMIDNSRITKDLDDLSKGKFPSRIISQETVDKCFGRISSIIGTTASGGLYEDVDFLCNEFIKASKENVRNTLLLRQIEKEKECIKKVVEGLDGDDVFSSPLLNDVSRLRGVLEVVKTRLDRLVLSGNVEVMDICKDLTTYLETANVRAQACK